MREPILLKLLIDLKRYKAGQLIAVKSAPDGLPVDVFWRSRVAEGCVEILNLNSEEEAHKKHHAKTSVKKCLKKEVTKDDDNKSES